MTATIKELYRYRELLQIWTQREIAIRYKQAFFGIAWAILQPLAMMLAFTLVARFLRGLIDAGGVPYPIFYYTALLPWLLFSSAVSQSSTSMINNISLVTKTYFPREILPFAKVGASFFDFLVASLIFVAMFFIYDMPVTWTILWVPVLIFVQVILMLGISLLTSSLTVRFRDLRFLVPMGLNLMLFLTPIIYPLSAVPENLQPIYMTLNPMSPLIVSYRGVLLYGERPNEYMPVAAIISAALFVVGYLVFKRLEASFADVI